MNCVACEDAPKAPNDPCAVCHKSGRTDQEIVDQTEELARMVLREAFDLETLVDFDIRQHPDPRCRRAWNVAKRVQEIMTATDVDDALANVEADEDEHHAAHPVTDTFGCF